MDGVLIRNSTAKEIRASDMLVSYCPAGDGLTYYYWDDWTLSGLLKPGGHTLTLGLAGGSGPRCLAIIDRTHRQTGVDLDISHLPSCASSLHAVCYDAFRFIQETPERFDTIWVDLYGDNGLIPSVLGRKFIANLRHSLRPGGLCFIHLFRPENRFYRYGRAHDPFEPLFAWLLADLGFEVAVFDHYASQTWVLSDCSAERLSRELNSLKATPPQHIDRWIKNYMLRILREPMVASNAVDSSDSLLWRIFNAPVPPLALAAVSLSENSGVRDLDVLSEAPEKIIPDDNKLSDGNRLRWETLALWLTAPGLHLSARCRAYLSKIADRYPETGTAEFELRRPLIFAERGQGS